MTRQFILDENIAICAQLGVNASGEADPACANLLRNIIDICHTIIFDRELYGRTMRQLNRPGHQQPESGPVMLRVLMEASHRPGKIEFVPAPPSFPEEGNIPQGSRDDTYIVRLAVATGATLVTADDALRQDLDSCGISGRYALSVLAPEDALGDL